MRYIVLMGPKHSGKTSTGMALAQLLSCGFADLDELITQRSGKSPRALYGEGPEIFRKTEFEALVDILDSQTEKNVSFMVIASGGGLIDNIDALSVMGHFPVTPVYLDVPVQVAWERISAAGDLPPFLKTDNPEETHRILHERRAAAYWQLASLVIDVEGKSPQEIALEIKGGLRVVR